MFMVVGMLVEGEDTIGVFWRTGTAHMVVQAHDLIGTPKDVVEVMRYHEYGYAPAFGVQEALVELLLAVKI